MQNNLKKLRKDAGLTQEQLANLCIPPIPHVYISRYESGANEMKRDMVMRISAALRVSPSALLGYDSGAEDAHIQPVATVPIVGYVGAGAEVFPIDDYAKGCSMEDADVADFEHLPTKLNIKKTVAVEVRGESMMPFINDGDLLFYDERLPGVPLEYINSRCIVWLVDGKCLVKWVRQGSKAGHYTLESLNPNDAPIRDALVQMSAKVKTIIPR